MITVSKTRAIEGAKAFRRGAGELQTALVYVVQQTLEANANAAAEVFTAAGLTFNSQGELQGTQTARAVWRYLQAAPEKGGLGMAGILRFDPETQRFTMAKNWPAKVDRLDLARIWANLQTPRGWLVFQSEKAAKAFDLNKAILSLVNRARREGVDAETLQGALLAASRAA